MLEQLREIADGLFFVALVVHYVLLAGIVWSVAKPNKRLWPPQNKKSWQFVLTWVLFYLAFFLLAPLAEEPWLEEHYGETYKSYKKTTPRFL